MDSFIRMYQTTKNVKKMHMYYNHELLYIVAF